MEVFLCPVRGCETDMTESDGDWRDQGLGLQTSVSWEDMGGDILERSSEFGSVENEKDTGGCGSGSILFNGYHRQTSGWIALPVCFGYISHSHQLTLSHYVSVYEIETGSLRTLGLANDRSQRLR